VEKYVRAARAAGVGQGGEPPSDDVVPGLVRLNETAPLPAAPQAASLERQRERIAAWLKDDRLLLTRIHELLARDGVAVSYTTLRRYVRRAGLWKQPQTTVRMADWPPGEAAEMDFGKLGMLTDAATQKKQALWALIVTLPASRYPFVWPMHRQTLGETIAGLEAAWRFFGGIPKRVILDNFAAAVAGPDPLEPRLTRGFLEYSQARGFCSDPARVRKPRDKPHVEANVRYVRERFFDPDPGRSPPPQRTLLAPLPPEGGARPPHGSRRCR
jgi:transposase